MIVYNQLSVPTSSFGTLFLYQVPARGGAQCTGFIVWGTGDGIYTLYLNGQVIGGGRTSAAQQVLHIDLLSNPIGLQAFDSLELQVSNCAGTNTKTYFGNLLVELL